MKTFLFFASYMFPNKSLGYNQGSISSVLKMDDPHDFPKHMIELAEHLKKHHGTDTVIINNITLQEWLN